GRGPVLRGLAGNGKGETGKGRARRVSGAGGRTSRVRAYEGGPGHAVRPSDGPTVPRRFGCDWGGSRRSEAQARRGRLRPAARAGRRGAGRHAGAPPRGT